MELAKNPHAQKILSPSKDTPVSQTPLLPSNLLMMLPQYPFVSMLHLGLLTPVVFSMIAQPQLIMPYSLLDILTLIG